MYFQKIPVMETLTKDDSLGLARVALRRKAVARLRRTYDEAPNASRRAHFVGCHGVWDAISTLTTMRMSPRLIATYVARSGVDEKLVLDALAKSATYTLKMILSGVIRGEAHAQ